ncbi:MAG: glycine zipper family protein [Marinibacterium sp.]|nr:glycine zipper family protein [Marinibacterium sp.]
MKTLKPVLLAVLLPLGFAACTGTGASYEPKLAKAPKPGYDADLAQCRELARSEGLLNPETRTKAILGAGAGALAGAGDADDVVAGTIVGAVAGTAVGAADTRFERKTILIECLKQRGQPVAG